jgi:hypothetical protein
MQPHKSIISACLLITIFFCSCKKSTDNNTAKTKTQLLSEKEWLYQEYYINTATTPLLYYQRNRATGNYADYDKSRLVYNADGTYTEVTLYGEIISGVWQFSNNETLLQMSNPRGTFNTTIVLLDEQHFNWQSSNNGGVLCKMIPQ